MSIVDQSFLLYYLPAFVIGYHITRILGFGNYLVLLLLLFSAYVYSLFGLFPSLVMGGTIASTYLFSLLLAAARQSLIRKAIVFLVVAVNLSALVAIKYNAHFFEDAQHWMAANLSLEFIIPLGLSFFTIQQIGYILDVYRDRLKPLNPLDLTTFVIFFPQLLAGPIVKAKSFQNEIGRFHQNLAESFWQGRLARGLTWFSIGLFKKVVIAEQAFRFVYPHLVLASPADASILKALSVGFGSLVALYFDFSGYSDMAIGIGLMFGILLPINFNAPLRHNHVTNFYRFWHITLHTFLRDNVFVPLTGPKSSQMRRTFIIFLVFFLMIIWHEISVQMVTVGLIAFSYVAFRQVVRRGTVGKKYEIFDKIVFYFLAALSCCVFISDDWTSAYNVLIGATSNELGIDSIIIHPTQSIWQVILIALVLICLPFETPTHAFFSEQRLEKLRTIGAISLPTWSPNLLWAAVTLTLLAVSFWQAGTVREVVYFGF